MNSDMEDNQQVSENEKLYANGYCDGYLLATYEPELAKQMPATDKVDSTYLKGLHSGIKQQQQRRAFLDKIAASRAANAETAKPRRR